MGKNQVDTNGFGEIAYYRSLRKTKKNEMEKSDGRVGSLYSS